MLGAIIGDTVGSRFEWHNHRSKDFDFLTYKCEPTDDSIMTLAIAKAILKSEGKVNKLPDLAVRYMQQLGRLYPDAGYGGAFREWIRSNNPKPYNSFGNGAAMRVSPVGFAAKSLDEAKAMSKAVTKVTHNHPEGIKGAEATTVAIFMALHGKSMLEIRDYIDKNYYPMNFTLDGIRDSYQFNETCQDTVPQAMMAFFESTGFEDAIRNAISIGGDSDTLAAITGGIAEAYYGIPSEIRKHELTFLDERLLAILVEFENNQQTNKISKVTLDNVRRILSSFFSWLEDEDYVVKSPVRRIHKVKTTKTVKETYSDEALELMRDHCDNTRDLAMIDLLSSTGMRVGELVKLNREDIDFDNRECVVLGKGDKERKVYFDARTKIHLQKYLDEREDENEALFVSLLKPFNRLQISGVEIRLRKIGSELNIPKVHPHKFRRTLATMAIDKGMPIEQVQSLLGHQSIDTTLRYAMVNQTNVKNSCKKFIG